MADLSRRKFLTGAAAVVATAAAAPYVAPALGDEFTLDLIDRCKQLALNAAPQPQIYLILPRYFTQHGEIARAYATSQGARLIYQGEVGEYRGVTIHG